MGGKSDEPLIVKGKRLDGRKIDELRPIKIQAGVLNRADGSCYVEWGKNKIIAAVYGPRELHPKHLQDNTQATLRCRYNMAPFSVSDRKRPGPDRRSIEISKVIREALERVVFLNYFPTSAIDVFMEVLQADAGTRCASLTAASVALADAGVPMRDLVASCAAGKVDDHIVLDLMQQEDNFGQGDLPLGYIPSRDEIVLLQLDGDFSKDDFNKAIELGLNGCKEIYEMQKNALKERYQKDVKGGK
ncbi:MAG: exosome complex exonuclease Rrp41 [Candidatus Altiarchaeota archaeon]|nr:exosome complex exonuclease Rrp41 [Candidatus Altiarchaeota archaeon]